jgi:hypothetical protein
MHINEKKRCEKKDAKKKMMRKKMMRKGKKIKTEIKINSA